MFLFFFLIWVILNGRLTAEIAVFGLVFAGVITLFAVKALGYSMAKGRLIFRNLPLILHYIGVLIAEIVKASIAVIRVIWSGRKPDPVLVEFHSGLPSDFQNVLLANSITLTPGTYTLEQQGDHFLVHSLVPEYAEGMAESSFVQLLRKLKH